MCKEPQRVDPLGFSIAREELLIEAYVPFGVDTSCGLAWRPLDGAVDGFILEVFVDVATVAGDACFWAPAVNVSTEGVGGVREEIHWRVGDAFLGRAERAIVRAYVVSFSGEEVFKCAESGIGAAFGSDAEEPQAGVVVW